jgi:hypothetical protein
LGPLLLIVCAMAYLVLGGVAHAQIQKHMKPKCRWRGTTHCDADCTHSILAGLSNVLWPIIVPIIIGHVLGGTKIPNKQTRTDNRHERELAEAQHRIDMATLLAEENRILDNQLNFVK